MPYEDYIKKYNGYAYHYTNAESLMRIMESNTLFATNVEFLNDSNEFWHSIELAFKQIEVLRNNSCNAFFDKILSYKSHVDNRKLFGNGLISSFVVSFTKFQDSSSFLERYGNFNIGIKFNSEPEKGTEDSGQLIVATEIIYSMDEKCKILRDLALEIERLPVEEVTKFYWPNALKFKSDAYGELEIKVDSFFRALQIIASWFKSESYEDEAEVRLMAYKSKDMIIDYRASKNAIVPYIKVDLQKEYWKWDSILIGSDKYSDVQHKAVEGYIKSIKEQSSTIPDKLNIVYSKTGKRLNVG